MSVMGFTAPVWGLASSADVDPSTAQALVKIAALLVTGLSVHVSLSPPNPPAPPKVRLAAARKTFFERCVRWVTFCSKMMVWIGTILDILATTSLAFPSVSFAPLMSSLLCPSHKALPYPESPPHSSLLTASPLLLLGALATLFGAVLRLACFRALGPLFTFELAITPSHSLVTTGPYAWVRHPSYTGIYLTLLGASAVGLAPGAWLRECALRFGACAASIGRSVNATVADNTSWSVHAESIVSTPEFVVAFPARACVHVSGLGVGTALAWLVLAFWSAKVAYALQSTNKRLRTEDTELRNAFGAVWDDYAERTRWRLLPGVF
ncbi:ICMT-domain-containing protein [Daedalea quercina L-15889]|uniref:Protein-S-isoprenylcysteine O-methyltransferase n=1 Tax=Daedalea quercina L-15889 TaxID=1314783 RepID=A0A165RUK2_9APHY|nr:ICMT-domain-containing protein [Daedalea quercina L-15889]